MTEHHVTVTLFTIATGKYIEYFKLLLPQIEKFLDPGNQIEIVVLTDSVQEILPSSPRVCLKVVPCSQEPWPDITLLRYHKILRHREIITGKIVMWCDADMKIVKEIKPSRLIGRHRIIFSKHPGYTFRLIKVIPLFRTQFKDVLGKIYQKKIAYALSATGWESRKNSSAYVGKFQRKSYVQGGFWFGRSEDIFEMCSILSRNIDSDKEIGLVAQWHDESHLNWFKVNKHANTLKAGFVSVDGYELVGTEKASILCLDKSELDQIIASQ